MAHGNLFVISGPAGAGKGTLVHALQEQVEDVWVSVSATTRAPRPGEEEGVSYFFLTDGEFDALVERDGFFEWARVHEKRYGTPKAQVLEKVAQGKQVILEIDEQGAFQVRDAYPKAILVFIEPPSFEELERRLVSRGTDDAHQIEIRLQTAKVELSRANEYDVVIVNDDLERATHELVSVVKKASEG